MEGFTVSIGESDGRDIRFRRGVAFGLRGSRAHRFPIRFDLRRSSWLDLMFREFPVKRHSRPVIRDQWRNSAARLLFHFVVFEHFNQPVALRVFARAASTGRSQERSWEIPKWIVEPSKQASVTCTTFFNSRILPGHR